MCWGVVGMRFDMFQLWDVLAVFGTCVGYLFSDMSGNVLGPFGIGWG